MCFRQLQATLYSVIMSVGLNSVTSRSEMCHAGQIINICKYELCDAKCCQVSALIDSFECVFSAGQRLAIGFFAVQVVVLFVC